jgi:hypothetical protein
VKFLTALVVAGALGVGLPELASCDELAERSAIGSKVVQLLKDEDFDGLERMATSFRRTGARTSSGLWKLTLYYAGVSKAFETYDIDAAHWTAVEKVTNAWVGRYPKSPTAHLAHADMLLQHAWAYRGPWRAKEVRAEDWQPFRNYVDQARQYLETYKAIGSSDPRWYELMASIANLQSWSDVDFTNLMNEGLNRYPTFYQLYFAAINYYTPKWGGSAEAIEAFAKDAMKRTRSTEGAGLYARIYWYASQAQYGERLFTESLVDWPVMKTGIDDLLKKYPDSWNTNNFAKIACLARDKPKTAELLRQIKGPPLTAAWGNAANFERCRAWVASNTT